MNNSADQRLARASMARGTHWEDRMEEREAALEGLRNELDKG